MGESILVNYLRDSRNRKQILSDAIDEYSNTDTVDMERLLWLLGKSMDLGLPRDAISEFLDDWRYSYYDMTVESFLDRFKSFARIWKEDNKPHWEFGISK